MSRVVVINWLDQSKNMEAHRDEFVVPDGKMPDHRAIRLALDALDIPDHAVSVAATVTHPQSNGDFWSNRHIPVIYP